MRRALVAAGEPGIPTAPNPRVGCVLLSPAGEVLAVGRHRGAGTPHAEVDALAQLDSLGASADGSTAVVTLEPCNHRGRTGPCAVALVEAGVARVVYAQTDPNPVAAGGTSVLEAAGVEVVRGVLLDEAVALNPYWTFAVSHGRPFVTWKLAATLDGRSAAADGTSRWITSAQSRADVHRLRASVDAVLVGTGTVLADDPALTARDVRAPPASRCGWSWGSARCPAPRRCSTTRPPPSSSRRATCLPCSPSSGAARCGTCWSKVAHGWPVPSWSKGWSTRSSPISPRCCWAPDRRHWTAGA